MAEKVKRYDNGVELSLDDTKVVCGVRVHRARAWKSYAAGSYYSIARGELMGYMDSVTAYNSENFYVGENSVVVGSVLYDSLVGGDSEVNGCTLSDCTLRDSTAVGVEAVKSTITRTSRITYSAVKYSDIYRSRVVAGSQVVESKVSDSYVRYSLLDNVRVSVADLHEAELDKSTQLIRVDAMTHQRYPCFMYPQRGTCVPVVGMGCWRGTLEDFERMISSNTWVESTPRQIEESREEMEAVINLLKARIKRW